MTDNTEPKPVNPLAKLIAAQLVEQFKEALTSHGSLWDMVDRELAAVLEHENVNSQYAPVTIMVQNGECLVTLLGSLNTTFPMPFKLGCLDYDHGSHAFPPSVAQIEDAQKQAEAWQEFADDAASTAKRAAEIVDRMKRLAQ